ncbi:hypothetical protein NN561_004856 [Cricetulus griseus]
MQRPLLLPRASKIRAARHALSLAPRSVDAWTLGGEAEAPGLRDSPSQGDALQVPRRPLERTSSRRGSGRSAPDPAHRPEARRKSVDRRPATCLPSQPSPRTPPRVHSPGKRLRGIPTLSCDLETLPLRSRSSAVKACQMALSSSSFKPPMAVAALPRRTWPTQSAPQRLSLQQELPRRRWPPCGHLTVAHPAYSDPALWGPAPPLCLPSQPRTAASLCPVWVCKHHAKSLWWISTPTRAIFRTQVYVRRNVPHPEEHVRL